MPARTNAIFTLLKPSLLALSLICMVNACANEVSPDGARVATFNISMGMRQAGALAQALNNPGHEKLQAVAGIIQHVRPDILLLNEVDYDPEVDAAALFAKNFLSVSQQGQESIRYDYSYRGPANTGIDSGLDIDGDGELGTARDAWGFGDFPGQYAMLVLSRYPINAAMVRSFQHLKWSDLPAALRPKNLDGSKYYPDHIWTQLRLSSKNHWDIPINIGSHTLHLLAFHPTPPVFDGPQDHNGLRNHDEIRLWAEYLASGGAPFLTDDQGRSSGLAIDAQFVIVGDMNADPIDGDSVAGAVGQLLHHERVDGRCIPTSRGAGEANRLQGGLNPEHRGEPDADTADFNDRFTGNLRIDYALPSKGLKVLGCGVFWPAADEAGHPSADISDHHLVWVDVQFQALGQ